MGLVTYVVANRSVRSGLNQVSLYSEGINWPDSRILYRKQKWPDLGHG